MPRSTSSRPPQPQVRLMFEPSHLAAGCLTRVYARLVPRTPRARPTAPPPANSPSARPAPPTTVGGTQP